WLSTDLNDQVSAKVSTFPEVKSITVEATLPVFLSWGERSAAAIAIGVVPADLKLLSQTRLMAGEDKIRDAGSFAEVMMGQGLADRLQVGVGDVLTATTSGRNQSYAGMDIKVSGIFEEGFREYDDWTLKLPISAVQRLAGEQGVEKVILILKDTRQTEIVRSGIAQALRDAGADIETTSWRDHADFYRQVLAMFGKELDVIRWIIQILVFLAALTCLAKIFTERQREMATLLAMGMTRLHLIVLFAQESFWLGLGGAVLGIAAGTVIGYLVSLVGISMPPPPGSTRSFIARVDFLPPDILHYGMLTLAVGCAAAIIPGLWILRLDPAVALREEKS
ncbi:MAG TPA: FtsX-like permease family protein, partial [Candidatus Sulfotelmatobacter sp.]|nr:FtsX-like permease family protein [Candidatus Sulfotelmatobacter sp.]